MIYILMFMSIWTITLIVARNVRGNDYARWVAMFLFVGGCASFGVAVSQVILPWIRQHAGVPEPLLEAIRIAGMAALQIYFHFIYYLFAVKAMSIAGLFRRQTKRVLSLILLVLPVWSLLSESGYYPVTHIDVSALRTWSAVYFVFAIGCYIAGYIKEKVPTLRRNIVRNGLVLIVAMIWAFMTDFNRVAEVTATEQGVYFKGGNHWDLNALVVLWVLLLFLLFALQYGLFGVRLKIEQQKLDFSIRTLASGTAMLNHALKNEVVKMNFVGERIHHLLDDGDVKSAKETLGHLFNISDQMLVMFDKIKEQTEEIVLQRQEIRINGLIDAVVGQLQPLADNKRISLIRNFECDKLLHCDPHHLTEVLNNLCLNAIDAISAYKGELTIRTFMQGGRLTVTVKDDGDGIPKERIRDVFAPFFTTKAGISGHAGLGLSYCYNVMKKHGGTIRVVETSAGNGTTFALTFAAKDAK